jgi:hypothetical protein
MSCASARRAPGRSRTRLPRAIGRPPIVTLSVSGDTEASASGSHQGAVSPASVSTGGSAAGRGDPPGNRSVPCRRARTCGSIESTRSSSAAARGSVARASAFSSSDSAIVRSVRISSISVPS